MRWLRRLFAVPFGLLLAVSASSLFLVAAAILDPVMGAFAGEALWVGFWWLIDAVFAVEDPGPILDSALSGAARLLAAVLLAPLILVALVSEVIGARGALWQAGGTALLTGALPWLVRGGARPATPEEMRIAAILALTGAVAGFVYWLAAGRGAGPDPSPAVAATAHDSGEARGATVRSPGS
ncbi:MAG TPA: hypothetical protein VHG30_06250 [Microvirga sp.]|nr:hypothetical protein [Microvirga sp.]